MLRQLETRIAAHKEPAWVVFLGDYVDRGPDSREVIETLLNWKPDGTEVAFLRGNHERAMIDFLDGKPSGRAWLTYGGLDTLVSYGIAPPALSLESAIYTARDSLRERLPATHVAFLRETEVYKIRGDYMFVHAGIDPRMPIADQSEDQFLWIREEFLGGSDLLPYTIVHGHTPSPRPYHSRRRIGLDLGGYSTGELAAAQLRGTDVEVFAVSMHQDGPMLFPF